MTRATSTRGWRRLVPVAIVAFLASGGGVAVASHLFPDVPTTSAFHDDVSWLVSHDIASGFPDGTFKPKDSVNRQQAARWFRAYNSAIVLRTNQQTDGAAENAWSNTTTCLPGERAVGGGGTTSQPGNTFMTASIPTPSGTGWFVRWESEGNVTSPDVTTDSYALCVPDENPDPAP